MRTRNTRIRGGFARSPLTVLLLAALGVRAVAGTVPLNLPRPDGKPGDANKPVKVYILAGQSNMVGFGQLEGARPHFNSIFLTADPGAIPGPIRVGRAYHNLAAFGIYGSEDPKIRKGAMAAVYKGAYDPNAKYETMTPAKAASFPLGTVAKKLPAIDGPHTIVAKACIEVPAAGTYTFHPGFRDSTHAIVVLDGKEVYRKDVGGTPVIEKVELEAGKRYPITITYLKGGSAAFWLEQIDLPGKGDLETLTKKEGKFPWMIDDEGKWTVRNDVTYAEARIAAEGRWCPLSATSNGKFIGPEVPFGYVMGTFHDEHVLLIETSMGNRALTFDFKPPSNGRSTPPNEWEGKEWDLMVKGVNTILGKIDQVVPDYGGQGYEIAGFAWFQGHKDAGKTKEEYEDHLVNLIKDLRKEFKAPDMRAVVATVAFDGWNLSENYHGVHAAQMAVGDPKQHPEFAGTVASVDARGFWRDAAESPTGTGYHYNHNAETYMLTGDALGRAMVGLLGGKAETFPQASAPETASAEKPEPTEEQVAASKTAVAPIIADGMLATYVNDPRNKAALAAAVKGEKPKRANQFLMDSIDGANAYYRAVGIDEYDWKPFGPDMKGGTWDYVTFDPPEEMDKAKGARYRKVTCPAGMEDWFAPEFDAKKAGWKGSAAPFGQLKGELAPLSESCTQSHCGCGTAPKTLWEKEVILMRKTVELPPLKDGHRYRIVVGGSCHVNAGEGFALYADGKLLAESGHGVYKRQGGQPRGAHIYANALPAFKDGKVTIAVMSFLRFKHPRTDVYPRGHISVWLEEQKLPPVGE